MIAESVQRCRETRVDICTRSRRHTKREHCRLCEAFKQAEAPPSPRQKLGDGCLFSESQVDIRQHRGVITYRPRSRYRSYAISLADSAITHLNGRALRKRSTEEAIGNEVKGETSRGDAIPMWQVLQHRRCLQQTASGYVNEIGQQIRPKLLQKTRMSKGTFVRSDEDH